VGVHLAVDNIVLKENRGVAKARHEAVRYSSGKLILFVDGDDMLSPDYVEKMVRVLDKGGDIAYPDLYLWAGGENRLVVTPKKITPEFVHDAQKVVIPVTSLMSRKMYDDLGGFKEWPVLEDLDFFIRAMCKGYTFKKAETLLWYRRYPGTRNSMDFANRKKVLDEIFKQFEFSKDKITYAKNKL
jgi:glycosyltransferase involved in cell wall biosynthesis